MLKKYRLRDFDFRLVILVLLASGIGVLAVGSANEEYVNKQIIGIGLGIAAMLVIAFIDYTFVLKLYWLMYLGIAGLLAVTTYSSLGEDNKGAQRWIEIGPITFQPSELAKIILILFFAQFIMRNRKKINKITTLIFAGILFIIPAYMVLDQPDLSTTIIIIAIFCSLLFAGGLSWRYIVAAFAIVIPIVGVIVFLAIQPNATVLEKHQRERILAFITSSQ